ncbi:MAG: flagellin, partial [Halobacteriovoraceae bacterium]|nr:flagellin [Halobacteriovoraceae bacterium]
VQAASDTIGARERGFTNLEFQQLKEEIDRIARSTEFNGAKLLDGTSGILEFQIGIRNDPILDRFRYDGTFADATLESLGLAAESVDTKQAAQGSLDRLDDALVQVNGVRAELGAIQNRLFSVINNIRVSDENLSAAKSRIRDVDMARETAEFAKNKILVEAGISVLGQANQYPRLALSLLK